MAYDGIGIMELIIQVTVVSCVGTLVLLQDRIGINPGCTRDAVAAPCSNHDSIGTVKQAALADAPIQLVCPIDGSGHFAL